VSEWGSEPERREQPPPAREVSTGDWRPAGLGSSPKSVESSSDQADRADSWVESAADQDEQAESRADGAVGHENQADDRVEPPEQDDQAESWAESSPAPDEQANQSEDRVESPPEQANQAQDRVESPPASDVQAQDRVESPPEQANQAEDQVESPPASDVQAQDRVESPPDQESKPENLVVGVLDEVDEALEPLQPAASEAQVGPGRKPLPRVMAIANQKGGVGKTTTAVNLGAALAEMGYRVLVVDLDPQGNATTGLGINARTLDTSIYDVLMRDVPLEDCIEPTSLRNLFVCPATIDLAGAEIELVPMFSRELRLRKGLARVLEDFDFVLIDCPPSLGLLTVNGLAAATEVIVPIQCEYYALEGLSQLLRNVNLVQGALNPRLELGAIILTMFDARTNLADQVATEVRNHFGPTVCRSIVPRTVRLSEAPSFGQPIIVFDPTSRGAIAYRELAKEVSGGAPQRIG
jgi:chromosome partitioning protein